ncbi:serine/threonine protein phosphatase [Chaetomidium leptoderma]|uniref:Serine/threonine-protein phosphatase n=1 Tax=Chaetomidium leptoderma TaxID=669021 RepID=A0AAN6VSB4_9PEZI|nr:serine/threonine protein phosphatase [Chaetomidium leptoderma]
MGATFSVIKTLVIPAIISLILFLGATFVLIPLWQRYRNRYSQYLPLETISNQTLSLRGRMQGAMVRFMAPSAWRARVSDRVVVADRSSFDSEDGEELDDVDEPVARAVLDSQRAWRKDLWMTVTMRLKGMATPEAKATDLKNQGNKAFAAHDWPKAIDFYTKAIELNDKEPAFWSNRAQAYLKTEAYGFTIRDATRAIELNPGFTKAYYRRATAHAAILKPKDAVKDFKTCVKIDPGNKDAKLKLVECEKVVRQLAFFAAIEVGDEPSAAEGLDVDSIAVEPAYDGARLEGGMTQEFIDDMTERFKNGKTLHKKYVYQIILAVKKLVYDEPTMVEVEIPDGVELTVCGDTHGQYFDLMELFRLNGTPSEKHWYLFNGDFVDRGSWSTEIALLLYANKWLRPNCFFINRGNHETDDMNRVYGFEGECKAKYSERVFKLFSESFSALPLATLIGKKYFVLHGGLFSDDNVTLDDIRKLDRHKQRQPGQAGLMMEMLWTDPQTEPGRGPSKRGVGMQFGPDVTKRFCDRNGLEAVIRSHEVRMDGYEEEHDGKCITVFSAPKYCDMTENRGAYINIGPDYKLKFSQFDAVPHPDIKPMAYAQNSVMSSLM